MAKKGTGVFIDSATGDLQMDVVRNSSGLIASSVVIGDATIQNQAIILQASKGEFKEYPTLGAAIIDMLNDHEVVGWEREVSLQLEADGMTINELEINIESNKFIIDANYD